VFGKMLRHWDARIATKRESIQQKGKELQAKLEKRSQPTKRKEEGGRGGASGQVP